MIFNGRIYGPHICADGHCHHVCLVIMPWPESLGAVPMPGGNVALSVG
jgi:hypothetical protein